MKVLKVNSNNLAEKYRNNRLYKHTPDIERYLYTKRSGSITELENKFTKEQIETAHILNKIKTTGQNGNKIWEITKPELSDIRIFYKKPSFFDAIMSIYMRLSGGYFNKGI